MSTPAAAPLRAPPEERAVLRRRSLRSALVALLLALLGGLAFKRPSTARLVTHAELARHSAASVNATRERALWLSICGQVFDVTAGAHHYGSGGGYAFFTGRDGTRAFVTGEFNEKGLVDDISNMSDENLASILHWVHFYQTDYKPVGLLAGGAFYDSRGRPLPPVEMLEVAARAAKAAREEAKAVETALPSCAAKWSAAEGGMVWCEAAGTVPRKLSRAGATRCACLPWWGSEEASAAEAAKRLAPGATLEAYANCAADSHECRTSGPSSPSQGG